MRVATIIILGLAGCRSGSGPGGDTSLDLKGDGASNSLWQLVTDQIEDAVLLSAWSDGPTLRIVGGDLGGGAGIMVHSKGDTLCVERDVTERALWWIHGSTLGEWTAVGESGTVLRESDGVRTRMDVPTDATLFGVYIDGANTWVAGGHVGSGKNDGEIWRNDGNGWEAIARDLPHVLFKVWGAWFVGQEIAYRYDAATGELQPFDIDGRLLTVRGTDNKDVWAVGGLVSPLIFRFEAGGFVPVDTTGLRSAINGVYTDVDGGVWIAGNDGTTAQWTGDGWDQPDVPLTTDHLHAVWRHEGATWWFGGDLFNTSDNHGTIVRHASDGRTFDVVDCES